MKKYPLRYWTPGVAEEYIESGGIRVLTLAGHKQLRAKRIAEHAEKFNQVKRRLKMRGK